MSSFSEFLVALQAVVVIIAAIGTFLLASLFIEMQKKKMVARQKQEEFGRVIAILNNRSLEEFIGWLQEAGIVFLPMDFQTLNFSDFIDDEKKARIFKEIRLFRILPTGDRYSPVRVEDFAKMLASIVHNEVVLATRVAEHLVSLNQNPRSALMEEIFKAMNRRHRDSGDILQDHCLTAWDMKQGQEDEKTCTKMMERDNAVLNTFCDKMRSGTPSPEKPRF